MQVIGVEVARNSCGRTQRLVSRLVRARCSVRRVTGTALGDLLLLGREVTHVVKVEVDFSFPPGQRDSGSPEHVVVRLSEAEGVPLAEHGIAPRDARGAVVSEQWAAFGRSPGLRAVVTGSLRFERARE